MAAPEPSHECESQDCIRILAIPILTVPSPAVEIIFALLVTFSLPHVKYEISKTLSLLSSSTPSDPHHPARLRRLMDLRSMRDDILHERDNLNKFITHLTEIVLFPFQPSKDVVFGLFRLAYNLNVRFTWYEQPEDLKSSLKYVRYLRDNFHSLDSFNIPRDQFTSLLFQVLAINLVFGSGNMIRDMEEMVVLIPEVLTWDVSTNESGEAITAFTAAVDKTEMFRRKDTQLLKCCMRPRASCLGVGHEW